MKAENPIEYEQEYETENGEAVTFYDAHKNLEGDDLVSVYRELQEKARRLIRYIKFKESNDPLEKIGPLSVIEYNQSQLEEVFRNINSMHKIFKEKNINPPPSMEERGI